MIILPLGLTPEEIRVLQEFRRVNAETLPLETIKAIKHPAAVSGEVPAVSLTDKGWLAVDGPRENFALTGKAKEFLAVEAKPMVEEAAPPGDAATPAAANPGADGA